MSVVHAMVCNTDFCRALIKIKLLNMLAFYEIMKTPLENSNF